MKIDIPALTLISYGSLVSVTLTLRYPNLYIYKLIQNFLLLQTITKKFRQVNIHWKFNHLWGIYDYSVEQCDTTIILLCHIAGNSHSTTSSVFCDPNTSLCLARVQNNHLWPGTVKEIYNFLWRKIITTDIKSRRSFYWRLKISRRQRNFKFYLPKEPKVFFLRAYSSRHN
jgi:hypothetical protein